MRIIKVINCTGPGGLGLNEGIERATDKAAWFRDKFDSADTDTDKDVDVLIVYDAVEFRFPAGRVNNGGILPRRQCAKWQKIEGPAWDGFFQFFDTLPSKVWDRVQIALPFPTSKRHIREIMTFIPSCCALRFEDLGSLAPQFMKRIQPLLDAGYRVGADTVPTDNIGQPGLATRFDLPRGYERVTWGVRSRIVRKWIERGNTPGNVNPCPFDHVRYDADGINLSLLLTGDADDVMPVADLERVRPLLAEVRVQNVQDPAMRAWLAATTKGAAS